MTTPVTIIMIEDDEGHARLIERNIRRSGVNNEIIPFSNGTAALNYLFDGDGSGIGHQGRALLLLLDLNLPDMSGIEILRRIKENQYLKSAPGGGADHHRRSPMGDQALLRTRSCNRLHYHKPVNYESFANAIRQSSGYSSQSSRFRRPPHERCDDHAALYRR